MSLLTGERWHELSPHLDRLLEMEDGERRAYLEPLEREDPSLAADLASLLAEQRVVGRKGFLEGSAPHPPAPPALAGQTFGAYTLESLIGRGGMGTVWLARRSDGRFEGIAAVKLLNANLIGRTGEERFSREGNILARLAHPHIARLVDAGVTPAGQPYLVLEHVDGVPIDVHCDERGLDVEERVRLFLEVLAAVEHAHANLIVHRDIKPSNVLVASDGQVKLLDFGIAKLLESDTTGGETALTREGGRAFTPEFAAPEQVAGGAVTTATDVYALGTLLYVLLVGEHPAGHAIRSPAELFKAILDTDPEKPSDAVQTKTRDGVTLERNAGKRSTSPDALRRRLKGDLDTIVAKALKKDPAERYASVSAFASDLRRSLANQPISARPDTLVYRTAKFVRRNRVAVALAALAAAALVAGMAGTLTQARRATRQAAVAAEQRDFALRQLARVEALNDLNHFLMSDAVPAGKPLSLGELLARAEELVSRDGAESDENRVLILIAIGRQYWSLEKDEKARELLQRAYTLSEHLPDRTLRARAACALAAAIVDSGQPERAEALIREGLRALPDELPFVFDRIFCLLRGREVASARGDNKTSVERAETARRLLSESGLGSALLGVRVAMDVAEAYRVASRHHEADAMFRDAFRRLEALGRSETETATTLLNNWALTIERLGRPLEAHELYRRAIEISGKRGIDDVSPMLLTNFARSLRELARLEESAGYADRAYTNALKAGDGTVTRQSLVIRGSVARMRGDLAAAERHFAELEERCKAALPPGHPAFASLASERSLVLQARGDLTAAASQADTASDLAQRSGDDEILARVLLRRALLRLELGRLEEARSDAGKALAIWSDGSGSASSFAGRASLALGRIFLAEGKREAARAAFARAAQQLEPTVGAGHPDTRDAQERLDGLLGASAAAALAPPAATEGGLETTPRTATPR